jgi:hypothetical protein
LNDFIGSPQQSITLTIYNVRITQNAPKQWRNRKMPDLTDTGTTVSQPDWMQYNAPEARLDAQDNAKLEAVDIRRQQIFNPKIIGSTSCNSGSDLSPLHAGLTLEAGVRLKTHGNSDSIFISVSGVTQAGASDLNGFELRSGEELFLEVNNLNLVSCLGAESTGCTLSYIAT